MSRSLRFGDGVNPVEHDVKTAFNVSAGRIKSCQLFYVEGKGAPQIVKHGVVVSLTLALMAGACRQRSADQAGAPQRVVAWRAVGSWSGHGNKQTESFTSESGALRIRWTTSLTPGAPTPRSLAPGAPAPRSPTPGAPAPGSLTRGAPAAGSEAGEPGGAGTFRVSAHSAISGRLLEQAVDHRGAGSGIGYVNQDPHVFYLMVESGGLDWTLSVEEAIAGAVPAR